MSNKKSKWEEEGREFDERRDTPFYEERSYGHRVGNGDETYFVNTATEEERIKWYLEN